MAKLLNWTRKNTFKLVECVVLYTMLASTFLVFDKLSKDLVLREFDSCTLK